MNTHSILHGIAPSDCRHPWDEMPGTDVARLCPQCGAYVYSVSGLDDEEIVQLVGRLEPKRNLSQTKALRRSDGTLTLQPRLFLPSLLAGAWFSVAGGAAAVAGIWIGSGMAGQFMQSQFGFGGDPPFVFFAKFIGMAMVAAFISGALVGKRILTCCLPEKEAQYCGFCTVLLSHVLFALEIGFHSYVRLVSVAAYKDDLALALLTVASMTFIPVMFGCIITVPVGIFSANMLSDRKSARRHRPFELLLLQQNMLPLLESQSAGDSKRNASPSLPPFDATETDQ